MGLYEDNGKKMETTVLGLYTLGLVFWGFGVWGLGLSVWGFGGLEFRASCLGFRGLSLFRVLGFVLKVLGLRFWV